MNIFSTFFKPFSSYVRIILLHYLFIFLYRCWELLSFLSIGESLKDTMLGFVGDVVLINLVLFVLYIPYWLLFLWKPKAVNFTFSILSILFYISTIPIHSFFLQSGDLIDARLFACSTFKAFDFAMIHASSASVWLVAISFLIIGNAVFYFFFVNKPIFFISIINKLFIFLLILSLPLAFELGVNTDFFSATNQRVNKSFFFARTSVGCALGIFGPTEKELTGIALFQSFSSESEFVDENYPLLRKFKEKDCLSKYFNLAGENKHPDIVLILVEGLGNEFISPMHGISFMPFLDQLRQQSLYWSHFLSPAQESVSALPSILGGLPFGEKGFSEIENIPYHFSLANVLHKNNYHTSFFYGQWAWRQSKEKFLNQNYIDFVWDATDFGGQYKKVVIEDSQFHWGYNDRDLFDIYFQKSTVLIQKPKLDIIYTGSVRAPFAITDNDFYALEFQRKISHITNQNLKDYLNHMDTYFMSLMFGDDELETFFEKYRQKENFDNTIFIITGSAPILEFAAPHPLKKYHVPLLIYSPLLNETAMFNHTSSQNDLYASFLSFMAEQYNIEIPALSSSLGQSLCGPTLADEQKLIFFHDHPGSVTDVLLNDIFLSGGNDLYKVDDNFEILPLDDDSKKKKMTNILESFNLVNTMSANQLMPDSVYFDYFGLEIIMDTIMPRQRIRSEYVRIIEKQLLENKQHTIDVTLLKPEVALNEVFVVFELINDEGQIVQWKNYGIPVGRDDFSFSINIDRQQDDSPVYLQLYIWNESPIPYSFGQLRATMYRTID